MQQIENTVQMDCRSHHYTNPSGCMRASVPSFAGKWLVGWHGVHAVSEAVHVG